MKKFLAGTRSMKYFFATMMLLSLTAIAFASARNNRRSDGARPFLCDLDGSALRLDYYPEQNIMYVRGIIPDGYGGYDSIGTCEMPITSNSGGHSSFVLNHRDNQGFSYCGGKLHPKFQIGMMTFENAFLQKKINSSIVLTNIAQRGVGSKGHYLAKIKCVDWDVHFNCSGAYNPKCF